MVVRKIGKYVVGRTIGEGTFAKVKFAQNTETGASVAMKVIDRNTIIKRKMIDQVLASRTKIYIILEFITGGELFDKIVRHRRLSEAESRRYFQQLIDGVDFFHSKGVFHRDLKPENLLLDSQENIKISDFGLSAFPEQGVSLLRTTCGTPNYIAPEIEKAEFSCPSWFPVEAKSLIHRILDPNPRTRITIEQIRNDKWFEKGYVPVGLLEYEDVNLDDLDAIFYDGKEQKAKKPCEPCGKDGVGPLILNAFDLIILSQGLNLASLFDRGQGFMKHHTRFVSQKPAKVVLSSMEVVAQSMGFKTRKCACKMRVESLSANKKSQFSVILEIFEVAPTFLMVDIQKAAGDASEYLKFYKNFCCNLEEIIWKPTNDSSISKITNPKSKKR